MLPKILDMISDRACAVAYRGHKVVAMTNTPAPTHMDALAAVPRPGWRPLARHYLGMVLAMVVGMLVLGWLRSAADLTVPFEKQPGTSYVLMAIDMSVGMAVWMRFRGHGWASTFEMCAAMFVPMVILPLVRAGAMDAMTFMMAAHVVMPLAMLVVLVRRRDEYAHC